eukprot:scaffold26643_cov150-Skeletonema_menzelii.AAC.7
MSPSNACPPELPSTSAAMVMKLCTVFRRLPTSVRQCIIEIVVSLIMYYVMYVGAEVAPFLLPIPTYGDLHTEKVTD